MLKALLFAAGAAFAVQSASAETGLCPKWEAGTRYPWQSNVVMRGDLFAWLLLDADRSGYPRGCTVAKNNYEGAEDRFWLCKQYKDRWRAPPASKSDPEIRRFVRFTLVPGPRHEREDRRARKAWFAQHSEARPECYPEPARFDRLDL
jgi:hypothetical protein